MKALSLFESEPAPTMTGTAVFSPCGLYRYHLTREWGDASNRCLFAMLNPSKATAEKPDNTVTRCIRYAKDWGFGALDVVNIFALRSTDPKALYSAEDPIGPDNDATIVKVARGAKRVIAAWGAHGSFGCRGEDVAGLLHAIAGEVLCLGETKDGEPAHPLYRPANFEPYPLMCEWAGAKPFIARVLRTDLTPP